MELYSLHPLPEAAAESFLQQLSNQIAVHDGNTFDSEFSHPVFRRLIGNPNPRPNELSFGFAFWLAQRYPVFAVQGLSLSTWEARVDRGAGVLLRPPSRLFGDAGLDLALARRMPIRIQGDDSMMGGAFIPNRLAGSFLQRLDEQFERSVRRLVDAEMDAPVLMGVMYEAARYAAANDMGLYEAVDVLDSSDPGTWPAGARVVGRPVDKALIERIRIAAVPPKEPGLIGRLFGRKRPER